MNTDNDKLVQNDKDRMDLIFDATEFLANLLARYASIEQNYGDERIRNWGNLQDSIVEVYTSTLRYVIEIRKAKEVSLSSKSVLSSIGLH